MKLGEYSLVGKQTSQKTKKLKLVRKMGTQKKETKKIHVEMKGSLYSKYIS